MPGVHLEDTDLMTREQMAARIAELEAALRPFAAIDGVAVPRMKMDPAIDRLWSYFESRTETQYEITRAHIIEAARVLGKNP
jgi:C4-dicarboxylate-specific signal transduction histidine kinase